MPDVKAMYYVSPDHSAKEIGSMIHLVGDVDIS
jgi:hypothetical protein